MMAALMNLKFKILKIQNLLFDSIDADLFAVAAHALEFNLAVDQGEQRIIRSTADIIAGMDVRTTLLDEDVARKDELPVRALDAETLGLGIAAVTGGTHSLFMCEQLQVYFKHFVHLRISL